MVPTLRVQLLGDFLLVLDDTPVLTINSPRLQSLLAYLVLHRSAPQDRSHLAFLLWPDSTEARAHSSLRKLLHQLRQALPDLDHFLHADRQTLYWQPDADYTWTFDIQEFEQAISQATEAQNTTTRRQALERVQHLYRGDLLPSCYDEWILPERDRLRLLFIQATERLITLLEQERDYDAAIRAAQHLLRQDPIHEATYRQLMRLYALHGDRAAALRVYHTCVTALERELGAEPSEVTHRAYEALLQSETSPKAGHTLQGTAPLLGRRIEWQRIQEAWRRAANGRPHIVLLSGEAGIGKTRLAEEMEGWVSRQGIASASARCYAANGRLAYAPVTTWLRSNALQTSIVSLDPDRLTEIARLVPEVLASRPKLLRPAAMMEGWQRQRFFEALARAVHSARQPLLLLLDDLQWCDNETLEWLHYLLRFEPGARLLLIGTVRSEETPPGHPLVTFLTTLQRDSLVTEIPLGPLTTPETLSLAEHILGRQLDLTTRDALYRETEGNPLFVVEMARTLGNHKGEDIVSRSVLPLLSHSASTLPPTVQSMLTTRFAQLSPLAREVANVAAVIGREFTFSVLARASGENEDAVVSALDELWQRRIVREQGAEPAETYDFSHDKLRELAYTTLSPAHKRLLHRRIADAFEAVYSGDLDAVSAQIAAHYEYASLPEQAIPYYQRVGEFAAHIYANTEALNAFERGVALLANSTSARQKLSPAAAFRLYESLGDIYMETGRYQEARQTYQHTLTFIPTPASLAEARLQRKMANSWNHDSANPRAAVHPNARQALQAAEQILTSISNPTAPDWRAEWLELQFSQIWPLRGSEEEMTAAIEKARPIIEQYGTSEQRERLAFAQLMRNLVRSRYVITEQRIASLRTELAVLQNTQDKNKLGISHLAMGGTLMWTDHRDEAKEHLRQGLLIGEEISSAWLQARCLTFLTFIFRQQGQVEEVRSHLKHAQAIGIAKNNQVLTGQHAWVAWRDGNLVEAETYGQASVEDLQAEDNPFQWVGLWPLIGVALAQKRAANAIDAVRALLAPTQQPPPDELGHLLEATLQAWDADQPEEALALLQQTIPLAEQKGYL